MIRLVKRRFLTGQNAEYVQHMFACWKSDPRSVHASWQAYFGTGQFTLPPTASSSTAPAPAVSATSAEVLDHMKVQLLVRAYQIRGHQLATMDPLGIHKHNPKDAPELELAHYGFTEKDLDRTFLLGLGILPRFLSLTHKMTLRELVRVLRETYGGAIGIEYGHINDRSKCDWLREKFEVPVKYAYTKEQKMAILDRLIWSDHFEQFVSKKYPSEKRFGLEGAENLIPGMKALIDRSVGLGVESIVMGMPHRGRLNVLSNVVRKSNASIFSEFSGSKDNTVEGSGDVKYHLGMNYKRPTPSGKMVDLSLVANPSHLEAVNPVVQGKVRGEQFHLRNGFTSMPVLMHGDAAFAAQGVVYETLGMTDLPAYTTGGTIHVIVNNQIGFTTDPRFARSSIYCSDVAKTVAAPVLHVNGDDAEAVVFCCELAADWRAKFHSDVVIDIVCYRKHGHNEIDQPGFTQPLMYERIAKVPSALVQYVKKLVAEGTVTPEVVEEMKQRVWDILETEYSHSKDHKATLKEWVSSSWRGFKSPSELAQAATKPQKTGMDTTVLANIAKTATSYPSDFKVHPNLARILGAREKAIVDGQGIDWATAESMAFGGLLVEGKHVRLSGQDVERGTFSQRHALLHDQETEKQHVPLNHITKDQAHFSVCNSSLSEFGTLGFELGYSIVSPNQLVLWEAQFGDFANNAQCIIDQFISSGEQKWLQRTGLTLLLPHGYDGQGPEHSSARLERFLQLCDQDPDSGSTDREHQDCNMQVVYPTVPSNYFHALRRQVHREFRKPLIVFASKLLLRHPLAKSSFAEMTGDTQFQRLIPEVLHPNCLTSVDLGESYVGNTSEPRIPYSLQTSTKGFSLLEPSEIKTLIFCSGQVYYLLYKARELNNLRHVAIVRLEQLSPFPFKECTTVIENYPNVTDIVYAQEESQNSGAWTFVSPRLETSLRATSLFKSRGQEMSVIFDSLRVSGGLSNGRLEDASKQVSIRGSRLVRYAGRDISAAPATGIKKQHKFEEKMLVSEALFNGQLKYPTKMEGDIPLFPTV